MQIKVTKRFIDEKGGRMFAPGEWPVTDAVGMRLIVHGKATEIKSNEEPTETSSPAAVSASEETVAGQPASTKTEAPPVSHLLQAAIESDIPTDFPERQKLIAAGITTVVQLKSEGIKEQIDKIDGIGEATMTKIGLAIAELP